MLREEVIAAPVVPHARSLAARSAIGLAAVLGAALLVQTGLLAIGFYRISYDEAARTLIALRFDWGTAFAPEIWPPFPKILLGLALRVWHDPFLVPRLLSSLAGLLVVWAVFALAERLAGDRRVALLAAALAVVQPQRLIFAVAPMSDIYYLLFVLAAAICVLDWLRGREAALPAAALCLALAETVRFEAILFGAALGLLVLHRWLVARRLRFPMVALVAAVLLAFPARWLWATWLRDGSLDALGLTSRQYVANYGASRLRALWLSPFGRNLALDLLWCPVLALGLWPAWQAWRRGGAERDWLVALFLPYLLFGAVVTLTLSVPMAAPWRTTGAWVLLALPFTAMALVRIGDRIAAWPGLPPWGRRSAIAALLAAALLPPVIRSGIYVRTGMTEEATRRPRRDRAAGLAVRAALARLGGGRALIESASNLDFLEVLALSGAPQDFVLNAGRDPIEVGIEVPMERLRRRRGDTAAIEAELTDRYALAEGGAPARFASEDIRLVLARRPESIAALDASPAVMRQAQYGAWVLYRVRRPG
ncbi:MAG TPA: glycosyltransferase family 39 protein [Crenalkalicoccus sp.]|nr:glycosyltransferase family 39 protein [Crenalkalicoccus sp.]